MIERKWRGWPGPGPVYTLYRHSGGRGIATNFRCKMGHKMAEIGRGLVYSNFDIDAKRLPYNFSFLKVPTGAFTLGEFTWNWDAWQDRQAIWLKRSWKPPIDDHLWRQEENILKMHRRQNCQTLSGTESWRIRFRQRIYKDHCGIPN